MRSKKILAAFSLVIILLLAGFIIKQIINNPNKNSPNSKNTLQVSKVGQAISSKQTNDSSLNKWGNSPQNINNSGYMASDDKWIYFYNPFSNPITSISKPGIYMSKPDGITGLKKLTNTAAYCINVIGDWVYFIEIDTATQSNNGIWKIRKTGKDLAPVVNGSISELIIYDGYMYYLKNNATLCKAPLSNPTEEIGLNSYSTVANFCLSDDGKSIAYYENVSDPFCNLCVMDTNGDNKKIVSKNVNISYGNTLLFYNNYIYTYSEKIPKELLSSSTEDDNTLQNLENSVYRISVSTGKKTLLLKTNKYIFNYSIHNNEFLYILENSKKVYSIDLNTLSHINSINGNISTALDFSFIYILNDNYYILQRSPRALYVYNTSNKRLLENHFSNN